MGDFFFNLKNKELTNHVLTKVELKRRASPHQGLESQMCKLTLTPTHLVPSSLALSFLLPPQSMLGRWMPCFTST